MIVIVDYGTGNLESIRNMLKKAGAEALVSGDPSDVLSATKLILPGVGHFDHGIRELRRRGLDDALAERVLNKGVPLLGICLGAQLLARGSEEGCLPGLGWIEADVRRFDVKRLSEHLRVPHMGWADVEIVRNSPLLMDLPKEPRFYFVHSFHFTCDREDDVSLRATHGYPFVAGVTHDNVHGVQFHPEKSHAFGFAMLSNFAHRVT